MWRGRLGWMWSLFLWGGSVKLLAYAGAMNGAPNEPTEVHVWATALPRIAFRATLPIGFGLIAFFVLEVRRCALTVRRQLWYLPSFSS